jgi:hypothetical protein
MKTQVAEIFAKAQARSDAQQEDTQAAGGSFDNMLNSQVIDSRGSFFPHPAVFNTTK